MDRKRAITVLEDFVTKDGGICASWQERLEAIKVLLNEVRSKENDKRKPLIQDVSLHRAVNFMAAYNPLTVLAYKKSLPTWGCVIDGNNDLLCYICGAEGWTETLYHTKFDVQDFTEENWCVIELR